MKTLISIGDIGDLRRKFQYKGLKTLRRILLSGNQKVAGNWDLTELPPTNWWNVPAVRQRWNEKICDGKYASYPEMVQDLFLKGRSGLTMASPGCGTGSHERYFAPFAEIGHIDAFDLSPQSIQKAQADAPENIHYRAQDFYLWMKEDQRYDIVFFYSSLHHFGDLEHLIPALSNKLNPKGLLVIHEYVGPDRMMWTREQKKACRELLAQLPRERRR
ncbi:MAG: class I SAM-dependent methyltransferase, partial [Bacteroidota bacterium]|nr:class I SAM-dependent methyltransferase [Bacteroidota bacterium]MDX5430574.1 class I SAM-dependent methyltransferase [Bacteroidota bacterium]MDX5469326.1 class I SAM-dependent methyltransferase [Bacteroidota bacterium]